MILIYVNLYGGCTVNDLDNDKVQAPPFLQRTTYNALKSGKIVPNIF